MSAAELFRRALAIWRIQGAAGLLRRLQRRMYWKERFIRWQLELAEFRPLAGKPASLIVRRGSLAELESLRRQLPGLPLDFYADRLYGSDRFYLGLWDEQLAHIAWVMSAAHHPSFISLEPGEVELMFVYTLRPHRGRGIQTHALNHILTDLQREPFLHAYAHVAEDNAPSLRAFVRLGFRPVATVSVRRALGLSRIRCVPGTPPGWRLPIARHADEAAADRALPCPREEARR